MKEEKLASLNARVVSWNAICLTLRGHFVSKDFLINYPGLDKNTRDIWNLVCGVIQNARNWRLVFNGLFGRGSHRNGLSPLTDYHLHAHPTKRQFFITQTWVIYKIHRSRVTNSHGRSITNEGDTYSSWSLSICCRTCLGGLLSTHKHLDTTTIIPTSHSWSFLKILHGTPKISSE